jgi:chaperone required for assembly of F1-ATPase
MTRTPPQKPKGPKRFYTAVSVVETGDGYGVDLDSRRIQTPAKQPLVVPTRKLAEAVAAEWDAQEGEIDRAAMPITRLAQTVADNGANDRAKVIADMMHYIHADPLCYRATDPNPLVLRQAERWQPILDWADTALGIKLEVTADLVVLVQPKKSVASLKALVEPLPDFVLFGLSSATGVLGSITLGLAFYEQHLDAAEALALALLDELWQVEQWGEDDEAVARRAGLLQELAGIGDFLSALR